jgi:predicted Holliday junction resolvase-like endonuclease
MRSELFSEIPRPKGEELVLRLFRHSYFVILLIIVMILLVVSLELRSLLKELIVHEAERDAVRISSAIRDQEIGRLVKQKENDQYYLSLSQEDLSKLD